jgi:hypothetical protein
MEYLPGVQSMTPKQFGLIPLVSLIAIAISQPAQAEQVELSVLRDAGKCPQKVIVTETVQVQPGSYSYNGRANFSAFAKPFRISSSDKHSVTWSARLKPSFRSCIATGKVVREGNKTKNLHNHLRIRFIQGRVFLILDMTGNRDINGFTTGIIKKSIVGGNPHWSWGGSD